MDTFMRTQAELAARLILSDFRAAHPAWTGDRTPVDELVAWLDLHVETFHPQDHPPGTYGFIDPDEDEELIWLCRNLSEGLRRFTLAHELGHAILHCHNGRRMQALFAHHAELTSSLDGLQEALPQPSRTDPCQEADVQEDLIGILDTEQFQEQLGIGQNYDPRSQREQAANIFASELLLPLERVRTLYTDPHISPETLANRFGVSNAAMLNRLAGLLKPTAPLPQVPQNVPVPAQNSEKKSYDEFQQAAITASTPALIVAGPGSGKTSTLIGRVVYMLETLQIAPQHILALTFSRKATREMEERLQKALGATQTLPKVSTFHAFCADLLRQHGELVGLRPDFGLIDEAEGYFLLRQQANALRLRPYQKLQAPTYYFPDLLKAISRAKDELISPTAYAALAQQMLAQARNEEALEQAEKALEVAEVYALYEEALRRRGDSDFGGLLTLTLELFHTHPEVLHEQQQKYQHLLVDEFQDVNRASGVLLRELAGEAQRVWVVGDANQAIYGFRGASPANISQFEQDFPGALVLPLSRNYRSRPDLVALAESFRCVQLEFGQEPGKNQPVRLTQPETAVTLAKADDEASELHGLIQDIRYKHANGYHYRDMIVLCRTRSHLQKISRALSAAHLPVIERGGTLEQEHTKDVLSMLLLLADNSGMGLLRAARQREHALSQQDIEALFLAAREPGVQPRQLILMGEAPLAMSDAGVQSLQRLSRILQSLLHTSDIWSLLAHYLLLESDLVRTALAAGEDKVQSERLADYDRLLQLARHYDQQQLARLQQLTQETETAEPAKLAPLEERVRGFLEYLSLLVLLRQDGGNRQGSDEQEQEQADIIRVMTVHASKGLEFPVVYMPGLVQRRFPMQARAQSVTTPHGMLPPESEGSAAHESGEACLFYVGVTRAREQLVLSYSERYGKVKYKRSPYLDALEAGLPAERMTRLHWQRQATPPLPQTDAPVIPEQSQPGDAFINAMKSPTLSAGALEVYQTCPRKYAYSNIYHFSNESDAYRIFWQVTQQTVEELHRQFQDSHNVSQAIPTQQQIQERYTQRWQEAGGHTEPFAPMYEQHGQEVVEAVRRNLSTQKEQSWELRPGFHVEVAGQPIHVTIDRIETGQQTDAAPKFVRTRFGKRKEKPSAEMRDLFYTLAYRQLHPGQDVELHSHNMSTGERAPLKMTEKKEQSLYESAEKAIEGLERNAYPAQPAEPYRCPTCPFFFICPA